MKLSDVPYPTRLCVELLHYATMLSDNTQEMKASEIKDHVRVFFADAVVDEAVAIMTGAVSSSQEPAPADKPDVPTPSGPLTDTIDSSPEDLKRMLVVQERLYRKIQRRDTKIAAMEQRIASMERALVTRTLDLESLSRNVERAVTYALSNVRMIPVLNGRTDKILEIRELPPER